MKIATFLNTPSKLHVVNTSTTVPIQCSTQSATFKKAVIVGKKAARTNNTGVVYIGTTNGNDEQFLEIAAGAVLTIEAPGSQHYDWRSFWLDVGTAGDGIMAIYS